MKASEAIARLEKIARIVRTMDCGCWPKKHDRGCVIVRLRKLTADAATKRKAKS